MNIQASHPSFEHLRSAPVQSLDIEVQEFRHKKTGSQHIHLASKNKENVFLVGLRTIPTDSTGVAHILEHTVLCGSEKFPVRDPFFMMIRRSLNTFMNAFTSSDWTAYPFASQNRKDFFNLLDVYLDAVFFSNLHELDFAQEGHRLEFEKADDPASPLVHKGVVFNEMKGAMSAATSILWQSLGKHLFDHNTYHFNSGGDPEVIPELTYGQLRAFYETHYHPSNAVFMTYGDIPAGELQQRFEDQVLSRFEALDREIRVNPALRLYAPVRVEEAYAVQDESLENKTHIVMSWLLDQSIDLDQRLRAHLLSSVLMDNSASPLMRALEQTDLGTSPSPLCGLEDSALEMVFVAGLEGSEAANADACEALILDTLETVARDGVPAEQVDAVLHQLELSQREIRGDGMPFGLQLVLGGLSSAMHRGDAVAAIDLDPALERLRNDAADPDFIPRLVREMLLENMHRVRLTLRPDSQLSDRRAKAEKALLANRHKRLTESEKCQIVERAQALLERQAQQDDPDILPKVTLEDVPPDMPIPEGQPADILGAPAISYSQGTNGLVYQHVIVPVPALDSGLLSILPLYTNFLAEMGSGDRDYLETQVRQAQVTGGLGAYSMHRGSIDDVQQASSFLVVRGKALVRNSDALAELLQQTLDSARFDELARLRELIAQTRAGREQSITGSGHSLAMLAAASGYSPVANLSHRLSGLAGIRDLKALDDSLDDPEALQQLAARFAELHEKIRQAPRQFMWIAEDEHIDAISAQLAGHFGSQQGSAADTLQLPAISQPTRQLWTTSTEVNFCARAYPTVPPSHEDAAALTVLGPVLRNGFLHQAIREKGGAYGGGATHDADTGSFRFYSYRDPRLGDTLADFDRAIEWIRGGGADAQALEEAVLNVIGSIDKPGSPAGEARSAYHNALFGRTPAHRRDYRRRIMAVTLEDLQRVSERYFDVDSGSTAVISSASIAQSADVEQLGLELHKV